MCWFYQMENRHESIRFLKKIDHKSSKFKVQRDL